MHMCECATCTGEDGCESSGGQAGMAAESLWQSPLGGTGGPSGRPLPLVKLSPLPGEVR